MCGPTFFLAVKRIKALRRSFLELYRHLHHFIMGWGKGKGYWNHHHHGHGIAKAVTEAAVIGGAALAGAAVATAVTAPRQPPPRKEVVVVPATVTPSVATAPVVVVEKGKGKGWWKGKGKGKVVTEVIEVPPLGISAVGVPANGLAKHEGTQFFAIDVVPEKGASYRVEKRYNDFDTLKDTLHRIAPGSRIDTDFPPKHLFSCEGPKLEDRRHGLERWLNRVLNDPNSRTLWCLKLRQFLQVDGIHTLPSTPIPEASAPMEPEGQVLQIVVPAGVSSGQALSVTVPEGPQVTFTVPPGVQAGSQLELWYDPTTGSVSPLV